VFCITENINFAKKKIMVKTEEIRVGNWISMQYYEGTELKSIDTQVTVNNIERLVNNADSMMLKGIELNKESLLKLGFDNKPKTDNLFTLEIDKMFSFEILLSIKLIFIYVGSSNYIRLDNIKYIHQLQNLIYSLTQTQIK
jgi:hypothetical protein